MGLRKFVLLWCCLLASVAAAQQPQTQTAPIYAANAKWTNGVAPGYALTKGAGLTLNIGAGTTNCFATIVEYAGGTLSLTNSTTNYVYLDTGSSCAPAFNTSGFTGATIPLAKVVTSGGLISSIDDVRSYFTTPSGPGTITGGTCTNQAVTALNTSGVPTCTTLTSAYVNTSIATTGGDLDTTSPTKVTKVNGASVPTSSHVLASNGSAQLTNATAHDDSAILTCVAASASGTAYTCATSPTFTPASGDRIWFQADVANTGSATLNVNSTSAKTIKKQGGGTNLVANDLLISTWTPLMYDGTNWQMTGQLGNAAAGGTVTTTGSPAANQIATFNSGTVIQGIDLPEVHIVPAANCAGGTPGAGWSYASGQWTPTCRAGTNNLGGVLQAIPSTGAVAQFMVELPTDWDTGTQPYINIFYGSGTNSSGTVINTVASACVDNSTPGGASDDPSFHAESAFSTQTMANTNRMWNISGQFTAMTSGNGCKATSSVIIKITLSGTASANVNYYKAVLTVPRKPVVQAE
jgi:hypothetical protein